MNAQIEMERPESEPDRPYLVIKHRKTKEELVIPISENVFDKMWGHFNEWEMQTVYRR